MSEAAEHVAHQESAPAQGAVEEQSGERVKVLGLMGKKPRVRSRSTSISGLPTSTEERSSSPRSSRRLQSVRSRLRSGGAGSKNMISSKSRQLKIHWLGLRQVA